MIETDSLSAQLLPHTVHGSVRFSPAYRSTHLGASQWPSAVGCDPYQEPIELFERFTGTVPWDDEGPNDAAELGHVLEDFIAKIASRRLGLEISPCLTLEHAPHPWAVATPDRLVEDGSSLQVKSTGLITRGSFVEEWGAEGTDEVPHRVLVQATAEMMILRHWTRTHMPQLPICTHTHVAAFVGQRGVLLYRVEFDEELAQMLFGEVQKFWRHVTTKKAPPPDSSDAFGSFIGRRYPSHEKGRWLETNDVLTGEAMALKEARAMVEKYEAQERAARNALCTAIGDAEGIKGPWGSVAWRGVKGRETLNVKRLLEDLRGKYGDEVDDIVRLHTERGAGYRAFRPTFKEEK